MVIFSLWQPELGSLVTQSSKRLILGTVQLGVAYGIANATGRPSLDLAQKIILEATKQGIFSFDTAVAYGDSELVLGQCLSQVVCDCEPYIISKLPPVLSVADSDDLSKLVLTSLERLQIDTLGCLMFHREEHLNLLNDPSFLVALDALKSQGLISTFGCSVYSPEKAISALEHELIDVIQIPASIFDRRFEIAGVYELAKKRRKTLHLRSALLQGVLCMSFDSLPTHLKPLAQYTKSFQILCREYDCEPAALAIAWLLDRFPDAFVLFGAELPEQVMNNVAGINAVMLDSALKNALENIFPPQTAELLNPALWRV